MKPITGILAGLALCFVTARARAHDFWVEPQDHAPEVGSVVEARLFIGHAGHKEPFGRDPRHIAEFRLVGRETEQDLVGRVGASPAGMVRVETDGAFALVYRSRPSFLEMRPGAFEAYLAEEGLDDALAERARRGESELPGRERYARCAKALLATPAADSLADRPLGLPFELVLEGLPGDGGDELVLRVLEEGAPRGGTLVSLESLDEPAHAPVEPMAARSDAEGRVRLTLPAGGRWLATAVHMRRAPEDGGHEWESQWASLVFPVLPAPREGASARQEDARR